MEQEAATKHSLRRESRRSTLNKQGQERRINKRKKCKKGQEALGSERKLDDMKGNRRNLIKVKRTGAEKINSPTGEEGKEKKIREIKWRNWKRRKMNNEK